MSAMRQLNTLALGAVAGMESARKQERDDAEMKLRERQAAIADEQLGLAKNADQRAAASADLANQASQIQIEDAQRRQQFEKEQADIVSRWRSEKDAEGKPVEWTPDRHGKMMDELLSHQMSNGKIDSGMLTYLDQKNMRKEAEGLDRAVINGDTEALEKFANKYGISNVRVTPVLGKDKQIVDYAIVGDGKDGEKSLSYNQLHAIVRGKSLADIREQEAKTKKAIAEANTEEDKGGYYRAYAEKLRAGDTKGAASAEKEVRTEWRNLFDKNATHDKDADSGMPKYDSRSLSIARQFGESLLIGGRASSLDDAYVKSIDMLEAAKKKATVNGVVDPEKYRANLKAMEDAMRGGGRRPTAVAPAAPAARAITPPPAGAVDESGVPFPQRAVPIQNDAGDGAALPRAMADGGKVGRKQAMAC